MRKSLVMGAATAVLLASSVPTGALAAGQSPDAPQEQLVARQTAYGPPPVNPQEEVGTRISKAVTIGLAASLGVGIAVAIDTKDKGRMAGGGGPHGETAPNEAVDGHRGEED